MESLVCILMDAFFIALLVVCSIADLKSRIVPNVIVLLLVCLDIAHVSWMISTNSTWWTYPAGLILAVPFFVGWLRGGIGAGDVKVLISVGLYLGLQNSLIAFAFMIPILAVLMIRSWIKNTTVKCRIPFAPVITIGATSAVLLRYVYVLIGGGIV